MPPEQMSVYQQLFPSYKLGTFPVNLDKQGI